MAEKGCKEKRSGPTNTFSEGSTPLHMACGSNQVQIVKLLMEHPRIDLNLTNTDGDCAVHFAARGGHAGVLDQLLTAKDKIRINVKNTYGYTPLHVAVLNNQAAIVDKLLQQQDCVADEKDNDGKTALDYAEEEGFTSIVTSLRKHHDAIAEMLTKPARE